MRPIFITGTGTDVGKTIASALLVNVLQADYWKPVQAGYAHGTDSEFVKQMLVSPSCVVHPEVYKLKLPASPHIAAEQENITISIEKISAALPKVNKPLIVEGAGGLLVPLNENQFITDLILQLNARVIIVSRNYLGSINHSLLTAEVCKAKNIDVVGWLFNDSYGNYEEDIPSWTGYPVIGKIAKLPDVNARQLAIEAEMLKESITSAVMKTQ